MAQWSEMAVQSPNLNPNITPTLVKEQSQPRHQILVLGYSQPSPTGCCYGITTITLSQQCDQKPAQGIRIRHERQGG